MKCPEAAFLNLVGCCYMKLTCAKRNDLYESKAAIGDFLGYPLSKYLRDECSFSTHLSYEAREIACHAIEKYTQRLSSGNYDNLRVHSFRAAIEKIICKNWPSRKHSGLRSVKTLTTFRDYCLQAVNHIDIEIPDQDIQSDEVGANLKNWKKVVIFYSLRLMLAPLVESVILYDRLLWLLEDGNRKRDNHCTKQNIRDILLSFFSDYNTAIRAIFDPVISARNHIVTAVKTENHFNEKIKDIK